MSRLPILGPKISTSHTVGTDPWLQLPAGKGDEPEDKREEDQSQRHSSSPVAGGTGRQTGEGVFGAWQMQGLIAGASLRPDPGTSSGDAGGTMGQAWAIPSLCSLVPPGFPELRAGFSWAAVGLTRPPWAPRKRQPGKWDTSGWPSTTCQHTWCGTRGCRGGPGAAAAPQSH